MPELTREEESIVALIVAKELGIMPKKIVKRQQKSLPISYEITPSTKEKIHPWRY